MSALASICFSTGSASRSRPHKLPPQFHAATISVWLLLLSLADRRRFSSCFYSPPKLGGVAAPSKSREATLEWRRRGGSKWKPPRLALEILGLGTPPNLGVPLPGRAGPVTARNLSSG